MILVEGDLVLSSELKDAKLLCLQMSKEILKQSCGKVAAKQRLR